MAFKNSLMTIPHYFSLFHIVSFLIFPLFPVLFYQGDRLLPGYLITILLNMHGIIAERVNFSDRRPFLMNNVVKADDFQIESVCPGQLKRLVLCRSRLN
jgi:hypothetical protein